MGDVFDQVPQPTAAAPTSGDIFDQVPTTGGDVFDQVPQQQPYESPYAGRVATVEKMPENLASDIKQIGGNIGAMLTLPFARAYEATPPGGSQPIWGRETDQPQQAAAVQGVIDYYNNEYIKPLIGDGDYHTIASDWNPGHSVILQHLAKAPLSTMMDLGIPTGAKAATKALAKAATPLTNKLAARVPPPLSEWWQQTIAPALTNKLTEEGEMHEHISDALNSADRTRLDGILLATKTLDKYWRKVPAAIRPYLTMIGEYTDRDLMNEFGERPEVQQFLNVVRSYNRQMETNLKIPDEINLVNKYGAPYLAHAEKFRRAALEKMGEELPADAGERLKHLQAKHPRLAKPLTFEDLKDPYHLKRLGKMKAGMDASGVQAPIHAALMTQAQLVKSLHSAMNNKLGGLVSSKTGWAAQEMVRKGFASVFDLPEADLPEWLQSRKAAHANDLNVRRRRVFSIRTPKQSLNVKDLTLERVARMHKFMAIRDFTEQMLKLTPEALQGAARKNYEKVPIKSILKGIIAGTPEEAAGVDAMFKKLGHESGDVWLPRKTAQMVQEVLSGKEKATIALRLIDAVNRTAKVAMFTLDPTFGFRLALQTAAIAMWIPKTPQQAVGLVVAHILAAHPAAHDAIPDALLMSHAAGALTPKMFYTGVSYERMLNWLKEGLRLKNKLDYEVLHGFQRRAVGLHLLLFAAKDTPNMNPLLALLNMDRTLQAAKELSYDPAAVRAMQKQLVGYMGDYSSAIAHQGAVNAIASRVFLVHAWARHAGNMIKTIPTEHPIKLSLMEVVSRVAATGLQPADMSAQDKEQGFIRLAHQSKDFHGWDLDVLRSGLGLLGSAATLLWGEGEIDYPSKLSPLISTPVELGSGMDLSRKDKATRTAKRFIEENPDVYSKSGKWYSADTPWRAARRGNALPLSETQSWGMTKPDAEWRLAHNMFSKQMDIVETASARKDGKFYAPSPFTRPGRPALMTVAGQIIPRSNEEIGLKAIGMRLHERR